MFVFKQVKIPKSPDLCNFIKVDLLIGFSALFGAIKQSQQDF